MSRILKRLFFVADPPKRIGRWSIVYCIEKIDRKVELSNEDHCGPCGSQLVVTKTVDDKLVKQIVIPDKKSV